MPSELLFPIDSIDLSAVAVDREEVGRLNPQTGHMRHLDRVIWGDWAIGRALGVKDVRDDEFWVPHHIPGRPLLPGVLMIEATAQLCSVVFRKKSGEAKFLGFTRCDDVVFRGQVPPGETFYMLCEEVTFRPRRFVSRAQAVVNDQLVFEATITGMVI